MCDIDFFSKLEYLLSTKYHQKGISQKFQILIQP